MPVSLSIFLWMLHGPLTPFPRDETIPQPNSFSLTDQTWDMINPDLRTKVVSSDKSQVNPKRCTHRHTKASMTINIYTPTGKHI
jgi:hypothetical protein